MKGVLQAAPQLIPAGLLVTVPLPVPTLDMARVFVGVASSEKVAVQFRFADIVTLPSVQSASPLQAVNDDPAAGVGVSATTCPDANGALQVEPQLMPAGLLVTAPLPVPAFAIVSVWGGVTSTVNVAVQLRFADIVTLPSLQSASPDQPANVDPPAAVAVNAITCPTVKSALHVAPQLMPAGLDATVPLPAPTLAIVRE
jgi:hypothetical protein